MEFFRLYTKHEMQNRFAPMDVNRGIQVVNLIRATFWQPDQFENIKGILPEYKKEHSNIIFQLRDENNKILYEI